MNRRTTRQTLHLEDALHASGTGIYTKYVIFVTGLILFAGFTNVQMLAVLIPIGKCDLKMTAMQKDLLVLVSFMGMIFSSHLFGFLADMGGRRKVMLVCLFACAVLSFLSSLSPNVNTLAIFWFLIGFMTGGLFSPAYVYVSEFCPKEIRAQGILIVSAMGALATAYLPFVASLIVPLTITSPLIGCYVLKSWRLFIAVFPITNLVPMILLYILPESPKFKLNEGNDEETLEILKKIYSLNYRTNKENYPVTRVILDNYDVKLSWQKQEKNNSRLSEMCKTVVEQAIMLFSREFILYTVLYSIIIMGILGMYNSFILWIPEQTNQIKLFSNMHPDLNSTICDILSSSKEIEKKDSCKMELSAYIPTILIGIAQFVVFLLISSFADKVNKKCIIVAMTGISAAGCIALLYVKNANLILLSLGMIVTVLLATYPVALSIAVEFYPTLLKSTAASVILLFGRIAVVILASVFGYLFSAHCRDAYWLAAIILICVAIIAALSPEKKKENEEYLNIDTYLDSASFLMRND